MSADAIRTRRAAFRALHASGCFLLPNPWDVGSAVALARLGAQALATTSSGHAWAHGQPDGAMVRIAAGILDRQAGHTGSDRHRHAPVHRLRAAAKTIFEVGVHR